MPLLNYTTTVTVDRTVSQVQAKLAQAGARQIMTTYGEGGTPIGIAFAIETPHGLRNYNLPVQSAMVEKALRADRDVPNRYKTPEHAARVAWRIIKDWLEAQLAIVETGMVFFDEVMLPYMQGEDGRTVYQLYLAQQLALGPGE